MQYAAYETEELAQLEKTEKQVDDILAARSQDKKDQAALAELTAEHYSAADYNTYDPTEVQTVAAVSTYTPITEITYADANGSYSYLGEFTLTGYCPCAICCGKWSNPSNPITSSGVTAVAGRTIAADTSRYPFGTKLMINGQIYTVEDVGGAIKGNHIDIFFNTHEEALAFGKQYSSVYFVQ
ncbi:MAG: 3D domain-containing protein [Lachnospiraceae bacterium]|nr:3D domain-containing protein [Lachnospiraceae bacterium]